MHDRTPINREHPMTTPQDRHKEKMNRKAEGRWMPSLPPKAEPSPHAKAEGVFRANYDAATKTITIQTATGPLVSRHPFAQIKDLNATLRAEGSSAGILLAVMIDGLINHAPDRPNEDKNVETMFV